MLNIAKAINVVINKVVNHLFFFIKINNSFKNIKEDNCKNIEKWINGLIAKKL